MDELQRFETLKLSTDTDDPNSKDELSNLSEIKSNLDRFEKIAMSNYDSTASYPVDDAKLRVALMKGPPYQVLGRVAAPVVPPHYSSNMPGGVAIMKGRPPLGVFLRTDELQRFETLKLSTDTDDPNSEDELSSLSEIKSNLDRSEKIAMSNYMSNPNSEDELPSLSEIKSNLDRFEKIAMSNHEEIFKMGGHDLYHLIQRINPSIVAVKGWKKASEAEKEMDWVYCTGFIIKLDKSTLIMTCGHFLKPLFSVVPTVRQINLETVISVEFSTLSQTSASVVYYNYGLDLCLLEVRDAVRRRAMYFGGLDYDEVKNFLGLPVFSVAHARGHDVILPYLFTTGRLGDRCIAVPKRMLVPECDCLTYDLPLNTGSSGAPIFDSSGEVIAVHSSSDEKMSFGIGLRSIRKALVEYFGLPKSHNACSADDIISKAV